MSDERKYVVDLYDAQGQYVDTIIAAQLGAHMEVSVYGTETYRLTGVESPTKRVRAEFMEFRRS